VAHSKQELKNPVRDGWSPDQIAGRLKKDYPNNTHWRITAETIYRWIYNPNQKKRKKKSGRKVHRSHIPDRISIRNRPEAINNRSEFGHWEGDTVEGKGKYLEKKYGKSQAKILFGCKNPCSKNYQKEQENQQHLIMVKRTIIILS